MRLLRQLGIILLICLLGEAIHNFFKLPIPGNVIGMIILFLCLSSGIIKLNKINYISKFLLDHLAFFFVPAGVGILSCIPILKGKWLAFLAVCLITTIIIIVITGWTIQLYIKFTSKEA
ncbi:holin-like protein [Clostridium tetanomorphum]|uniref:CidA/LrgA family protein n=1 Tax=Clostridium tetanomorphum TaxID=1553 RepID=A0A923E8A0_CLOTT|nr:CidA/LrgA family protein [Clostridium tetanomorphum]KAJ53529.1 LrgA family protein [Clostridium tetanomorphum DSM 665]MBC2396904.1 CidA/LrgA family protein [Clostridium tetanomorphum]MBP1863133.1 holin-like protein [Clostridium tetanomorphum]NRS84241.1 holin-like protein [Clostridium tetanomorphum]NRZ97455.1 holin-like protein [Clostridium tetanomorphum]